jgi:hypothetical protein
MLLARGMVMAPEQKQGAERRQFVRIKKNYIIRFCEKNNPSMKFEVSQVENISRGGLCFTSTLPVKPGAEVAVELRTPYVADTIYLEGTVMSHLEKVKGMIYEVRLKFHDITSEAAGILEKIEKYNLNKADLK